MSNKNDFIKSTLKEIEASGRTTNDVIFIGSLKLGHRIIREALCDLYTDAWTSTRPAASDLAIVFSDNSQLCIATLGEVTDWVFVNSPFLPVVSLPIYTVLEEEGRRGTTLEDLNKHLSAKPLKEAVQFASQRFFSAMSLFQNFDSVFHGDCAATGASKRPIMSDDRILNSAGIYHEEVREQLKKNIISLADSTFERAMEDLIDHAVALIPGSWTKTD